MGTLRVTEPLTTSFGDCGSVVTRHRAMADGTKRTSRDLGAASPEQKPARPASEVVGDLLQRREGAQGTPSVLLVRKERGPKYPAAQTLNGVVAPVAFYEVVAATAVHWQVRRVRGSSHCCLSVSVLRLWLRDSSITASSPPSGCGCHFATPFLRRVRCRSGSQTK